MMDTGYTYSSAHRVKVSLYAPADVDVPDTLELTLDGKPETFMRLSDRSLYCGKVDGVTGACDNHECHRRVLGDCQCGRHEAPVPFSKAVTS